jgi:hypothetical protein
VSVRGLGLHPRRPPARTGQAGQAAVELLALTPALLLVVTALVTGFLAFTALVGVEHALGRGVLAAARGDDPVAVTRAALPRGVRAGAAVRVERAVLRVRVDLPGAAPVVEIQAPLPVVVP